jgi:hypothetical protein
MWLDPQSKQALHHWLFQQYETRKAYTSGVYLMHRGPNLTHFVINQMSDGCEAYFPAVRHKEDMTIDKENINANANRLLELQ